MAAGTDVGVIVCGGRGRRLGPLGEAVNKCLLPFRGEPMIMHAVALLTETYGCTHVVFVTGHLGEQVETVVAALSPKSVELEFHRDETLDGTLSATDLMDSLGVSEYAYTHGNISLGQTARETLTRGLTARPEGACVLASSLSEIAPTHPHLRVEGPYVRSVGDRSPACPWTSVGTGLYCSAAFAKKPTEGGRFEDGLSTTAMEDGLITHVDVGTDWYHLEDLSFYA